MRLVDENGGGRPAEFASDSVCLRFVLNGASIHLWKVRQIAFPLLVPTDFPDGVPRRPPGGCGRRGAHASHPPSVLAHPPVRWVLLIAFKG